MNVPDIKLELVLLADHGSEPGWTGIAHVGDRELCRSADREPEPYRVLTALIQVACKELGSIPVPADSKAGAILQFPPNPNQSKSS